LSEEFANSHCFSAREPGSDERGLIGIGFEPTADRDMPDVSGVLWLDEQTAELRFVEYRYTDPPWDLEVSDAGGRIEFERLPTGVWIVSRWWIRMPVIALRPIQTVRIGRPPLDQYYLAAIREAGAWVAEVTTEARQPVGRFREASAGLGITNPTEARLAAPSKADYRSGWRIAMNVNLLNTGSDVAEFGNAPAFQGTVRFSTAPGLQLAGGAQFSRHGMTNARHRYGLFQLFTEPRFALHELTSRVTPFFGARLGRAWELVDDRGATFRSTGLAYGVVGGATLRLESGVSLEFGLTIGAIKFGDFSATTDRRWEECVLEQGALGTTLPATVVACSPPEFWTGPQLTPGSGISGTGDLPRITYENTARNDLWRALWVGVEFRLDGR
jgi:hypothetical protein